MRALITLDSSSVCGFNFEGRCWHDLGRILLQSSMMILLACRVRTLDGIPTFKPYQSGLLGRHTRQLHH